MSVQGKKLKGITFAARFAPEGRASYPAVFTPVDTFDKKGKEYKIEVLYPLSTDLKPFKAACDQALAEAFGPNKAVWPKNISFPFTLQDELIEKAEAKGQSIDHYTKGAYFVRYKTNAKNGTPVVVDQQKKEIVESSRIYGGCWVKASCHIQINEIKQKDPVTKKDLPPVYYVTPYLQGVQLVRDDDSFGGRPNIDQMFEPVVFDGNDGIVDPLS